MGQMLWVRSAKWLSAGLLVSKSQVKYGGFRRSVQQEVLDDL